MEEKINIAAILKDKPKGIRLYSPIFGECAFCYVREDTGDIRVKKHNGEEEYFDSKGLYNALGEVMLFPSRKMRDWLKFTWKKCDVLQHSEYPLTVIFESFEDDTYTSFKCKYCFNFESASKWLVSNSQCSIKHFYKVSEEEAKEFIGKVELNYNGKLNLETLEIEKAQPEFKDGDIVSLEIRYIDSENVIVETYIVHGDYSYGENLNFYAGGNNICMIKHNSCVKTINNSVRNVFIRYATDSEKQKLFDILAKEGKAWDAEKKAIVDLPKKCEFKAMDWCLMRDKKETWKLCQFSFFDDGDYEVPYNAVGGNWFDECIPYNEDTKHLLGTTDEWKGGEG